MTTILRTAARRTETHLAITLLGHDSTETRRAIPASLDGGRIIAEQVQRYSAPQSGEPIDRVDILLGLPASVDTLALTHRLEALGDAFGCDTCVEPVASASF